MARRDEEFAKDSFHRFLDRLDLKDEPVWEDGSDPPDFFLSIGAERFDVEVTRVVAPVSLDGNVFPKWTVTRALRSFAEQVQREARDAGILQGAYVLFLEPVTNFEDAVGPARATILGYLAETQGVPKAEERTILRQVGKRWSVKKLHPTRKYLAPVIAEGGGGWEGEIRAEFAPLLERTIERKVASGVGSPRILLLVDDYHYAPAGLWQHALAQRHKRQFHTVARTFLDWECQILSSTKRSWLSERH